MYQLFLINDFQTCHLFHRFSDLWQIVTSLLCYQVRKNGYIKQNFYFALIKQSLPRDFELIEFTSDKLLLYLILFSSSLCLSVCLAVSSCHFTCVTKWLNHKTTYRIIPAFKPQRSTPQNNACIQAKGQVVQLSKQQRSLWLDEL